MKNVKINFEGRNEGCAFFALYAGLRMYNEYKQKQHQGKDSFSTAGAEAYSIMEDLRYSHPEQYEEAKKEYDSELKNLFIANVSVPKGTLPKDYFTELDKIEQLGQNQESLQMQISVLRAFANKLGLYDVFDYLKDIEKAMHH